MWYIPKIVVLCTKLFNMHIAPLILWKEIEYQIWSSQSCKGFMLPLPCSWCYEWYHIVFLCWICIECMSSEPLWKMYLHGNKHFLNLNLNLNGQNVLMQRHSCTGYQIKMSLEKVEAMSRKYGFTSPKCSNSLTKCNNGYLNGKIIEKLW